MESGERRPHVIPCRSQQYPQPDAESNQQLMAGEGAIEVLVAMLGSSHPQLQRQSSKALANLGVNSGNKDRICKAGALPHLIRLAGSKNCNVAVEAVAALANVAVNGER